MCVCFLAYNAYQEFFKASMYLSHHEMSEPLKDFNWLNMTETEKRRTISLPHVLSSKYTLYKQPDLYFRFVKLHKNF